MIQLQKQTYKTKTYFWANDPGSTLPGSILAFTTKKDAAAFIKQHLLINTYPERIGNRFWVGWGLRDKTPEPNLFYTKGDFAPFQRPL